MYRNYLCLIFGQTLASENCFTRKFFTRKFLDTKIFGFTVCDLAVWGVWQPQTEALFDFHVCNTDAQSYANRPVTAILDIIAKSKKAKHRQACWESRADFTPFIVSTDGVIEWEGHYFLKRLASRLSEKWSRQYSETMNFVRTQLSLAILRAMNHSIRGARKKLMPLHFEDGAAMSLFSFHY